MIQRERIDIIAFLGKLGIDPVNVGLDDDFMLEKIEMFAALTLSDLTKLKDYLGANDLVVTSVANAGYCEECCTYSGEPWATMIIHPR